MTPFHTHDCKNCTYLGSGEFLGENVDVYRTCEGSDHTYIMRYGNDGDYVTVMEPMTRNGNSSYNFCEDMERIARNPNNMLITLRIQRELLELQLKEINDKIDFYDQKVVDYISNYGK